MNPTLMRHTLEQLVLLLGLGMLLCWGHVLALQQELSCRLFFLRLQPLLLLPVFVLHHLLLAPAQEVTPRKNCCFLGHTQHTGDMLAVD